MKITRVYADGEGDSHFEDLVIELRDAGPIGHLSEPFSAKEVLFRRNEPGYGASAPVHRALRRRHRA